MKKDYISPKFQIKMYLKFDEIMMFNHALTCLPWESPFYVPSIYYSAGTWIVYLSFTDFNDMSMAADLLSTQKFSLDW
jgi:hypothetical protein